MAAFALRIIAVFSANADLLIHDAELNEKDIKRRNPGDTPCIRTR